MSSISFQDEILQGIPKEIPPKKDYDKSINHAPKRKQILSSDEKKLALTMTKQFRRLDSI